MTSITPTTSGPDLAGFLGGADNSAPDEASGHNFAAALQGAANDRAAQRAATEKSGAQRDANRKADERRSDEARADEARVKRTNESDSNKATFEDDAKDAVTGDAGDATLVEPAKPKTEPAKPTDARGLNALSAGAAAGGGFVNELKASLGKSAEDKLVLAKTAGAKAVASTAAKQEAVASADDTAAARKATVVLPAQASETAAAKNPVAVATNQLAAQAPKVQANVKAQTAVLPKPEGAGTDKSGSLAKVSGHRIGNAQKVKAEGAEVAPKAGETPVDVKPDATKVVSVPVLPNKGEGVKNDGTKIEVAKPEAQKATGAPVAPAVMVQPATTVTPTIDVSAMKPVNVPVPTEPFRQVVQFISPILSFGNGDYSMTMQLHPAELGSVQVQVQLLNGQISMQMTTDNPGSRQALMDSMKDLRETLEQSGLDTGSLDVSTGDQQERAQDSRNPAGLTNIGTELADEEQNGFFNRLAAAGLFSNSNTSGDGPLDVRV